MGSSSRDAVPVVVGIGEVLWDILPERRLPGGAPANVVFHCRQLGMESYLVSEIGNDDLGIELKNTLIDSMVETGFLGTCQDYPTGAVSVGLDTRHNPRYEIQTDVAWDYIRWSSQLENLARRADAVCFGSLAQRSAVSRETIHRFLECVRPSCLRVFDINLREPYVDSSVLLTSLKKANVVKMNSEELNHLSDLLQLTGDMWNRLTGMVKMFDLSCIALTRGALGSVLVTATEAVDCHGLEVDVKDTVGAGDAFTAALIVGLLRRRPLRETNAIAGQIAAFVCAQVGAMVTIPNKGIPGFPGIRLPIREYQRQPTISEGASVAQETSDGPEKG